MISFLRVLKQEPQAFRIKNKKRFKFSNRNGWRSRSSISFISNGTKRRTSFLPYILAIPFFGSILNKNDEEGIY